MKNKRIKTKNIIDFCQEYLEVNNFSDYCLNGLQVEGCPKVNKIVTGVSLSTALIKEAVKKQAQMIIVHHGIFGNQIGNNPQIKGFLRQRLKLLLENDINLAGFHLPLDAHPKIGNNISLCRLLGIRKCKPLNVGFIGELEREVRFDKFVDIVNRKLGTRSYTIAAGPKLVKRIGVISGGASPEFELAYEASADTYICGDVRESVVRGIIEIGINFINAGHYNTEKLGIKNLGNLIARRFGIKVEFVDIPCDV